MSEQIVNYVLFDHEEDKVGVELVDPPFSGFKYFYNVVQLNVDDKEEATLDFAVSIVEDPYGIDLSSNFILNDIMRDILFNLMIEGDNGQTGKNDTEEFDI